MTKRRNDYRLTRRGIGIDSSQSTQKVVETFDGLCLNCQEKCEQQKVEKYAPNGQKAYQIRCSNCGFKRFKEYADRSNYKRPDAKKARLVQAFQEFLWDWVMEHIEKIISFHLPDKINLFKGRMGFPRRHKGKPVFSSSEFHPDFLRYLDTPEYIKRLSKAIKDLESSDPEACDFLLFRAMGYSFPQIDETNHFSSPLTKPLRKSKVVGHGNYERTGYGIQLNKKATAFLIHSIPEDLLNTFGTKNMIDAVKSTIGEGEKYTTPRDVARSERVTCPMCNGKDSECSLCRNGTVPKRIYDNYQKKIASGGTWE